MKITDVNLSIGSRDSAGRLIDYNYLIDFLDDYRIDRAVCFHQYALLDPKEGNARMAKIAEESNGRVEFCAVLDPILSADNLCGEGSLAERLKAQNATCVRIFPKDARIPFHPFYWEEILDATQQLKLPLFIDFEYDDAFICALPRISKQYPQIKFVLLRQGACQSRFIMPILEKTKNVYFTFERMLDNLQLEEIDEKYGCDKLLFGSGYPERPIEGALGLSLYANITDECREKILFRNWEAITK